MDNIKLIVFAFLCFFSTSSFSDYLATSSIQYRSGLISGVYYTNSVPINLCYNIRDVKHPGAYTDVNSSQCRMIQNNTLIAQYTFTSITVYTCSVGDTLIAGNMCTTPDPVCTSTEQLINHQCVADPVCTSTEQLINHQCVADPICTSTEQLINHQCVADPVCASTEYLSNHVCLVDPICTSIELLTNHICVPDPVCTSTELLVNHQCIANPNLNTNPDVILPSTSSRIHYTQTVVGTTLRTKFGTKTGSILYVTANDFPLNSYVGVYWDPADGSLYYSYKSVVDLGDGQMVPVKFRDKISFDSIADMLVAYQLNPPVASADPFQFLDFFFKPAEAYAQLIALLLRIAAIFDVAHIICDALGCFEKIPPVTQGGDCILGGIGAFSSPETACAFFPASTGVETWVEGNLLKFSCVFPSGVSGGGSCSNYTVKDKVPISLGLASSKVGGILKGLRPSGGLVGALGKFGGFLDLMKALYDGYKEFTGSGNGGISSKDPFGQIRHPSNSTGYNKPYKDKPDAEIDPSGPKDKQAEPEKSGSEGYEKTKTDPDGTQTKTKERYKFEPDPDFPDEIVTTKWRDTTGYDQTGNPTGTTHEQESPKPSPGSPSDSSGDCTQNCNPDPCSKDPTTIGCSHWGTPEPPEEIKTHEMDISIDPGASSGGSCPSDNIVTTRFGSVPISYKPVCLAAGYINPILISFAWLSAGFILFGAVKE